MPHEKRWPGESDAYRVARDRLLEQEAKLRQQIEQVAALRRELPLGGKVEDYAFTELGPDGAERTVKMSELFERPASLALYSFMYGPEMKQACPLCTSLLDGLDGTAPHVDQRINFAVVAKSPIGRIAEYGASRGWRHLRLLSSHGTSYNADYYGEDGEGNQWPMLHVFSKIDGEIRHRWASELFFDSFEGGQTRHVDLVWPLWNLFDLTPEGRGTDWYPKLSY